MRELPITSQLTNGWLQQPFAQLQHQRRLAAAHRAADADGESAPVEVAVQRPFALVEMAGAVGVVVRVTVAVVRMEVK